MPFQIFIIDADASAAEITAALARRIAPTALITCVARAELGWRAAQQRTPDAIIIDPAPHDQSAWQCIVQCRTHNPLVKIIVLSSAPSLAIRRHIQRLGVDVYLEKPVARAVLVDQIRAVLTNVAEGHLAVAVPPRA